MGWRPCEGELIPLSDDHLKRIGCAAVLEGQAKSIACSMLRTVEQLDHEQWVKIDSVSLKALCGRLKKACAGIDDQLTERLQDFDAARESAHHLRHMVVHACWAEDAAGHPTSFDVRRQRLVSVLDIEDAMRGCAQLLSAAKLCASRVGELVIEGAWPERPAGQGLAIRTRVRTVRL